MISNCLQNFNSSSYHIAIMLRVMCMSSSKIALHINILVLFFVSCTVVSCYHNNKNCYLYHNNSRLSQTKLKKVSGPPAWSIFAK